MSVNKRAQKVSSLLLKSLIAPTTAGAALAAGYFAPYRAGKERDPSVGGTALTYGTALGGLGGLGAGLTTYGLTRLASEALNKAPETIPIGKFVMPRAGLAPLVYGAGMLSTAAAATGGFGASMAAAAKGARLRREDEWSALSRDTNRIHGMVQAQSPDLAYPSARVR